MYDIKHEGNMMGIEWPRQQTFPDKDLLFNMALDLFYDAIHDAIMEL